MHVSRRDTPPSTTAYRYYGDFFNYTRQKRGEHALIMSRPVDSYPLLNASLSAYLQFSPK